MISAIFQVVVFSIIPFIVYIISKKRAKGFFDYIGIKKSNKKANLYAILLALLLSFPLLLLAYFNEDLNNILTDPKSVSGKIKSMGFGFKTLSLIFFTAVFKTALAEEIFFRGFVAKRLIAMINFKTGNIIQALIFGVMHSILFLAITKNFLLLFLLFLIPAIGAYIKVYLNEKVASGSIIPGWIAHALGNTISYTFMAFII